MSKKLLIGSSSVVVLTVLISVFVTTILLKNDSTPSNNTETEQIEIEPKQEPKQEDPLYEQILPILESMTLEEKVGQLLFVRIPEGDSVSELTKYHFGGYILFGRDVEGRSLEQIKETNLTYKNSSIRIEPFIGIDEEGGSVSRLSSAGLADFKSPKELLNEECGQCAVEEDTRNKAALLGDLGINVNFAPVADLCDDPNSFISARTAGSDPKLVSDYVATVTNIYSHESKVSATLKHFPGYGCNVDTHTGVAIDNRTPSDFDSADFLPFSAGIESGADFVMISHNIIEDYDSNPASLSAIFHDILTYELGFSGIMITDDLSMAAISEYYNGWFPAVVQAVIAGNNMMIVSDYETAFNQIIEAVGNGALTEEMIEERIIPVLKLKAKKEMRLTR